MERGFTWLQIHEKDHVGALTDGPQEPDHVRRVQSTPRAQLLAAEVPLSNLGTTATQYHI